jgi:hypothetical protein
MAPFRRLSVSPASFAGEMPRHGQRGVGEAASPLERTTARRKRAP